MEYVEYGEIPLFGGNSEQILMVQMRGGSKALALDR
jgi:hypothetical protein